MPKNIHKYHRWPLYLYITPRQKRYGNKLDQDIHHFNSDTLGTRMFPMKKFDKLVSGKFGYQLFITSLSLWRCMYGFTSTYKTASPRGIGF